MSLFQQSGVQLSHIDKLSKHSIDATFETALALLDNTSSWEDVKKYNEADGHVIQYSRQYARPGEKLMWHMRSSEHGPEMDLSYAEFRAGLLLNHTPNEQQYVPDLKHSEQVKSLHEGLAEVWLMQYKTPPFIGNREFAELLLTTDMPESADGLRSFIVVQVPVLDVPTSSGHERGRYISIEHVEELSRDGPIRWRMATASSAGGRLPQKTTDLAMPSQITHDVPNFIIWARKQRAG